MALGSSMLVMSAAALALTMPVLATGPAAGVRAVGASGEVTWEPTASLDDHGLASFAVDDASTTTVVWKSSDGTVKAVRHPADGSWSDPEVIGRSSAWVVPQVVADAAGDLTAVWVGERKGFTDGVLAATRPAGGEWSRPVRVSRDRRVPSYPGDGKGPWGAADLSMAVNPKGAVTVAWEWGSEDRAKPFKIQSVRRGRGGRWSRVVDVTRAREDRSPQLGMARDGTTTLVYQRQPLGHRVSFLSRVRHAGSGWGRARILAKGFFGRLAVDRAGDAALVYSPDFDRVSAVYRHAGRGWGRPHRLSARGAVIDQFSLAMNARGRTLVAMGREQGRVDLVTRPVHGIWSAPVAVVASSYSSSFVSTSLDRTGDSFVGWGDFSLAGIYRPRGGAWSNPSTVSPDWDDPLEWIRTLVAPNGEVVVMWAQESAPLQVRATSTS